jgi:RHS repeat-associated protein
MKLISLEWEEGGTPRAEPSASGHRSRLFRPSTPSRPRWRRALISALCLSLGTGLLMGLSGAPNELKLVGIGSGRNIELTGGGVSGTVSSYTPGELWGGGSEVENCSVCSPSGLLGKSGGQSTEPNQPVDPMTGGYTDSEDLFSAAAPGGDLSMSMTYDSGLATAEIVNGSPPGYFGYGWESTMSGSGVSGPGNTFIFTDENTSQTTFTQLSSDDGCPVGDYADFQKYTVPGSAYGYCAANRVDAQLGLFPAYGAYEVERSGGKVIDTYDAYGRLSWIATNATTNSEPINFTYGIAPGSITQCPAEGESSCFMETDQSGTGRTVTAEVDGLGLVQKVSDPMGRKYIINYTDGDGDMNQIERPSPAPGGGVATKAFAYTTTATSPYNRDLTTITDPVNDQTIVTYTNLGMVYTVRDGVGNTDTFTYAHNDCALPTSGDCTGFGWIQTTGVTYSDGEVDSDVYTSGMLTQDTWGSGTNTETWTFGYAEPTSSDQDAATVETVGIPGTPSTTATIDMDSAGNVLSYTDPNGNTTTSMYNDSGGNDLDELCWTAPAGSYIAPNVSCTSPPSGATTYSYDSYGDQTSQTDPFGSTTRSGYYANGMLCWTALPTITAGGSACSGNGTGGPVSAAPAGSTTYTYNLQGDVTSKTVAASPSPAQTTTSSFDPDDEVLYTIPPDGLGQGGFGSNAYETSYSYEPDGSLASQTAPLSRGTSKTYDAAGDVLTTSDPTGVTTNAYEGDHRLCWSYRASSAYGSNACGAAPTGATKYSSGYHGGTDAPNAVQDPDGQTTINAYGDARFPTKATQVTEPAVSGNPQTNIITYSSYDAFGDTCMSGPVSTGAAGTCAQLTGDTIDLYNAEGQLNPSYNPDGQGTTYAYGDADFPTDATSVTNPLSKTTQYSYDADGRLTSAQDPEGNTVTTGYDADSRSCYEAPFATVASCSSPPTGSGVTLLTYDQAGQRVGMSDNFNNGGAGQLNDTYSYDANGNLLSSSNDNGQANTYAYNQDNQDTCISYVATAGSTCAGTPTGSHVTRGYNSAGELASTTDWLGNTVSYTNYNALSEVQTIAYPSATGESLTYGYDADGNVTGLTYGGTHISGLSGSNSWTPNADNQVSASSSVHSYASPSDTYDQYDRVRQATNPSTVGSLSGADTYAYNNDGDLTGDTPPTGSQITHAYNNGDQLTSVTNPNNPASTEYESLNYTADGQRCWSNLASSVTTQACGSAPTGSTQYAWNTYGQLCGAGTTSVAATCTTTGSTYTGYTYDGNNVRMTSTTNSVATKFDWDTVTGGSTPLDISDGTNSYIYGPLLFGGTAPIEQISSTGTVSFMASTQSGVQAVFTNGSSPTLTELAAYTLWGTQVVQSGSKATPFGFQGSYTDVTGLIYLINRYYDPSTSQFLSIDPDVAETGQPYAYTADDPLNATDPMGLHALPARFWTKKTLPKVANTKLRNIMEKELWKYGEEGHVGNGSSMAAVEKEAATGRPTKGVFHEQKLVGAENGLKNLLEKPDGLSAADRVVANQTYSYVRETLYDFDSAVAGGRVQGLSPARTAQAVDRFQSSIADTALGDGVDAPISAQAAASGDDGIPGGGDDVIGIPE